MPLQKYYVIPIGYARLLGQRVSVCDCGRTAVNLAAFGSAFVLLVAAVRGICNLNNLPRWCLVLFGLEFSAFRIKEHDAQIFLGSLPAVAVGFHRGHRRANTTAAA